MKTRVRRLCLRAVGEPVQNIVDRGNGTYEPAVALIKQYATARSFPSLPKSWQRFARAKTRKRPLAICEASTEIKGRAGRSLRFLRSISHTKTKSTRPIG